MSNLNMGVVLRKSSVASRIYAFLVLFVMPTMGLFYALEFFAGHNFSVHYKMTAQRLAGIGTSLKKQVDEQQFWAKKLIAMFSEHDKNAESFCEKLAILAGENGLKIDYIVYDSTGRHIRSSLPRVANPGEWINGGWILKESMDIMDAPKRFVKSGELRRVFGRDFNLRVWRDLGVRVDPELYPMDFIVCDFFYWTGFTADLMVVVRFHHSDLKLRSGLRDFFRSQAGSDLRSALFSSGNLVACESEEIATKIAYAHLKKGTEEFYRHENRLYSLVRIGPQHEYLLSISLPRLLLRPGPVAILLMLFSFMVIVSLVRSGRLPDRLESLPLLLQILALVAITTGIPLSGLAFVGIGYFMNRPVDILREKYVEMQDFVEEIKRKIPTEHSRVARLARATVSETLDIFHDGMPDDVDLPDFRRRLPATFFNAYLIKDDRVFKISDRAEKADGEARVKNESRKIELSNVLNVARSFLFEKNGLPFPEIPVDQAYMLEMFLQKTIPEIIHMFMSLEGRVEPISWGNTVLVFSQAFKTPGSDLYDLYSNFNFDIHHIETAFIERNLPAITGNPYGFKVFVSSSLVLLNEARPLIDFPEVYSLFASIVNNSIEPRIVDFAGEPHLFFGEKRDSMRKLDFCALYPIREVDKLVAEEASDLLKILVLAIFIMLVMVTILYLNLLIPVQQLHRAAQALRDRNSRFRLQDVGNDEFGDMAQIFNQSIEELEELQIASLVQAKLLPSKAMNPDGFSVYGKSVPMADLGGDYFDYFYLDDDRFAVMMGDVAGHGVGAALIMAIAKSGIICASHLALEPALFMKRLHQIVLATKSKVQRKVMTFQYLVVDRLSGQMKYSNAGGCSPALVDSRQNTVVEVSHAGAVLGGFKKNVYTDLDFEIKPGQAIVFYTDGMVESRNHTGIELGYRGLFDIFLQSFDVNAEKYYENILQNYRQWLGGGEVGDDMTVVIMVYDPLPLPSEEKAGAFDKLRIS